MRLGCRISLDLLSLWQRTPVKTSLSPSTLRHCSVHQKTSCCRSLSLALCDQLVAASALSLLTWALYRESYSINRVLSNTLMQQTKLYSRACFDAVPTMASITNLPTEIVESIARHLDMKDLCSFRLAQPAVIPAQTTDRLRELHLWNAATYTRSLVNAETAMDWDTSPHFKSHWGDLGKWDWIYEQQRYDRVWIPVLINISAHPVYSDWITSVCLFARLIKPQKYGAYQPRRLSAQGLGAALAKFRQLFTLWLHGECLDKCSSELSQILRDLLDAGGVSALRNLVIHQTECNAGLLAETFTKHSSSLREVTLSAVKVRTGGWVKDVLPALQQCSLRFFLLNCPLDERCPTFSLMFRRSYKYRPDLECEVIHFEGLPVLLDTDYYTYSETAPRYGVAGKRRWRQAIRWLCESREVFLRSHSHGVKDCREYFCDVEEEMAYRRRYRAENDKGHQLPGEWADDQWYDESMDEIFRGMYDSDINVEYYHIEDQMEIAASESVEHECIGDLRGGDSQDSLCEPQDDKASPDATQEVSSAMQGEHGVGERHDRSEMVPSDRSSKVDNGMEDGVTDKVHGEDFDNDSDDDDDEDLDWSQVYDWHYFWTERTLDLIP